MAPDVAARLDHVQLALRGPVSLLPLDVLAASRQLLVAEIAARAAAERRCAELEELSTRLARFITLLEEAGGMDDRDTSHDAHELSLAERAPALDRWRSLVLASGNKRSALERAAAWELEALECERAGNGDLAHRARLAAAQVVRRAHPHRSPSQDTAA